MKNAIKYHKISGPFSMFLHTEIKPEIFVGGVSIPLIHDGTVGSTLKPSAENRQIIFR